MSRGSHGRHRPSPALGKRQVLRPGAKHIDDTEPAKTSITIRHLMAHTSGLSYGIFDPGSVQFEAYNKARVSDPSKTLAEVMNTLAPLPLSFHPGTRWEYSVASDVLGRVVELFPVHLSAHSSRGASSSRWTCPTPTSGCRSPNVTGSAPST